MAGNWSRNGHYLALDDLPTGPVSPPSSYQQSFRDSVATTEHGTPTPYDPGADVTDWQGSRTSLAKPVNLDLGPTVNERQTFLDSDMAMKKPAGHFGATHAREVCSSRRLPVLWSFLTYHLPSVAITCVLFSLYLVKQVWGPPGPAEDELSALQLAAKVHEILVLISLLDILLHRVRYGLLGNDGVAMGFLLSPFHVASPQYLFSWEFWGTVLHAPANRQFHRLTAFIIVILTLVGVGTGPVSAIAMIPRLQWMEISPNDPWYRDHVATSEDIYYLTQDTYPMMLDTTTLPTALGLCLDTFTDDGKCNIHTVTPMIQNFVSLKEMRQGDDQTKYNITTSRDGTDTPYRPISVPIYTRAAFATGAMDFAAWELTRNYLYQNSNRYVIFQSHRISHNDASRREKWKQPAVTVTCAQGGLRDGDENYIDFKWDDDRDAKEELLKNGATVSLNIEETFEDFWIPLDTYDPFEAEVFYLDLNLKDQVSVELSAALLFANNTMEDPKVEHNMELCLIQAGWLEAEVWADTRLPTGAQSNLGISKGKEFETLNQHVEKEGPILMKGDWFGVLGASILGNDEYQPNEPRPNTDYVELHRYAVMDNWVLTSDEARPWMIPEILSKLVAIYVTDAMTMMMEFARDMNGKQDGDEFPDDARNVIRTSVHQHLWAYTLNDSKSRPASFAILLSHVLIVLVHHAVILLGSKPWHGSGWGNLEELISLALRSRVPQAADHPTEIIREGDAEEFGSRKQGSEPRNIPIVVRETGREGSLEIMIASRRVTNAASAADLGNYTGVKRVTTGTKYCI